MFTAKQSRLFPSGKGPTSAAPFVQAALKNSAETRSGNHAKKYATTGNPFVDQFSVTGNYKNPRSFEDITHDCEILWAANPLMCVAFIIYLRMINRVVDLFSGVSTSVAQKGAEMRYEGIMRMLWLHIKAPETFWKNIGLFISAGSWKDVFVMLSYDLQYHGWNNRHLDWDKFGRLLLTGLENEHTSELIKKYLPQIRSNNKCRTIEAQADNIIAKWVCYLLFGNKDKDTIDNMSGYTYKKYRQFKSGGAAHEWQKLISRRQFDRLDFASIHGRALNLLVKGKFLKNHNLIDRYREWIKKPETTAKYTGFVHELFKEMGANGDSRFGWLRHNPAKYQTILQVPQELRDTINKQFITLVEKAGEDKMTSFMVVRDTSGSMAGEAEGTGMTCYAVAKALALYFSYFLKGPFADSWIEFNKDAKMHMWKGATPLERWFNDHSGVVGNTNFQSVIDLFIQIKRDGVEESLFPTGILCISDGEFNPGSQLNETNVETALRRLRVAGFSEEYINNFVIVLWNMQSNFYGKGTGTKFETFGNIPNVFYFSGYSAATIGFLSEKVKNAEELFEAAMDQELLNMVEL